MHKRCGKAIGSAVIFFYIIAFVITPQSAFAVNYICGKDLNGNNYAGDPGEIQSCLVTTQGMLCPIEAANCTTLVSGNPVCQSPAILNTSTGKCETTAVCPDGGSLNSSTGLCETAPVAGSCPSGYTLNGNICTATPTCSAGFSYDLPSKKCITGATCKTPGICTPENADVPMYNCPLNSQDYNDLNTCNSSCVQQSSCTSNTTVIFSGTQYPPETSGWWGSFNWIVDSPGNCWQQSETDWMCTYGNDYQKGPYSSEAQCLSDCHTSTFFLFDICNTGADNLYFHRAGCGNQTYNLARGQCVHETGSIPGCGGDSVWLSASNNTCPLSGGSACDINNTCTKTDTCSPVTRNVTKQRCDLNNTLYDTSTDCTNNCFNESACTPAYTCPLGSSYACMENMGTMQCSPNTCVDDDNPANTTITDPPLETLTDDGAKDAEGRCLGTIYFFNGIAMGCNKSGKRTSWKDCCSTDKSMDAVQDKAGTTSDIVSAVGYAKNAYDAYKVVQAIQMCQMFDQGAVGYTHLANGGIQFSNTATGVTTTFQGGTTGAQVANAGVTTAANGGTAAQGAASAAASAVAWSIVIYVIVQIIIDLISQGCSANDIITDTMKLSGTCHYIGDMCTSTMELMGCVQKTEKYCCFNTKLARIIHEQGRPQLKSFGPSGGWGTPELPNCRGFLAEEFQMLDFSKMDLSEYYEDIKSKVSKNVQQNVGDRVQQYYDKTTNK